MTWELSDSHQVLAGCFPFLPYLWNPGAEGQEHTTVCRRVTGKTGSGVQSCGAGCPTKLQPQLPQHSHISSRQTA